MKKLLSLLFLFFGFFFFWNSFAWFVEVWSGYVSHNSFPYYSNVFVIPFWKYAIKVHNSNVEVDSYDLKQKYSSCKIHYNASWQSIFYLYYPRVNHLVLFSHSDGHSCYAMSLVDIDLSNWNCESLDWFYNRSSDKCLDDTSNGNLVLAYDKDNFFITDKWNSDYWFIVTPTSTGIDYTWVSVWFQNYVKWLTFLDVGSAKLFWKSNNNIIDWWKSFYWVFDKDFWNTNKEILYLYDTDSILSYSPNTSTIQQRYYLTWSNLFVQGSVYNRIDKSEFIFNSANSVFTWALTYHYDTSEFGKYSDNFIFPYTSTLRFASPYSDFVKSGSNLWWLFYDSTDFNVYYSYYDLSGNYFYSVYSLESTWWLLNTDSISDWTSSSSNISGSVGIWDYTGSFFSGLSRYLSCPSYFSNQASWLSFFIWTPEIKLWILTIPKIGYNFDSISCLYGAYLYWVWTGFTSLHTSFYSDMFSWSLAQKTLNRVDSSKLDKARFTFVAFILLIEAIVMFYIVRLFK